MLAIINNKRWTRPFWVFSLLMILKIYLSWVVIFGPTHLLKPLITGIPSVWVAFCLIEIFVVKRKLAAYIIVNAILTTVYFAAIMYFKYYGVIVNYHALQQASQVVQVRGSVMKLMHPYYLLIFVDLVIILGMLLFSKGLRRWGRTHIATPRYGFSIILVLSLIVCSGSIWNNRGVINEIKQAEKMGIINYELYTVLSDLTQKPEAPESVTMDRIRQLKGIADPEQQPNQYWAAAKDNNVIVIQLESFQNLLVGLEIDGIELTPTLNKLVKETMYFPKVFQQVGQGNTSDAEFVVNTSFYIPPRGAASQVHGDKELPSMPKLFREHGYRALTFHTNDVAFWNRDQLYEALGFETYYDRTFFEDEDLLFFGSSDEVLYDKTVNVLADLQSNNEKFYAHVIAMSSHHPYELPDDKKLIQLPESFEDTLVGNYLSAAHYADYALGQFIEELKLSGLWDQSLIVLYGDHMGLPLFSLTEYEKDLLAEYIGREYDYVDLLNIPLLVSIPGIDAASVVDQVGGQVDFMPTIANLVGISLDDHIHFGQDLFQHRDNLLPQRYYLPSGSFINDQYVFIPGEGFADGKAYMIEHQDLYSRSLLNEDDYWNAQQLIRLSDSYVKHLPKREVKKRDERQKVD